MAALANRLVGGRKGARICGVILLALGLFLAISLISHSPHDFPNSSRPPAERVNLGGQIGAYLSYVSFVGVGYAAYVLPLLFLVWGWNRLLARPLLPMASRSAGLLGMALFLCVGAGLPEYSSYRAFELGGWVGTSLSNEILVPYAGRIGSAVLLAALLVAAVMLTTDLELRPVLRALWRGLCGAGRGARRVGGALQSAAIGAAGLACLPVRLVGRLVRSRAAPESAADDEAPGNGSPEGTAEESVGRPRIELPEEPPGSGSTDPDPDPEPEPEAGETAPPEAAPPVAAREAAPLPRDVPPSERTAPKSAPRAASPPPAAAAAPATLDQAATKPGGRYRAPSPALLDSPPKGQGEVNRDGLLANARVLEDALGNFDVAGKVVEVSPGPVVTRYEVEPAAGVKVNRIVTLADDLARVMSANGIRIQAPVPGKSVVGVEIANQDYETVYLSEILKSRPFRQAESKLTMALGKTISGEPFVADLARMPHLLVAGATGAGKSVCINSLITSILYKATPDEVRFLMVDPKVVELTMYNDIPHLLTPVITEPKKASEALKWTVAEMERRYQQLARLGVRNLADYNRRVATLEPEEGVEPDPPMPFIVAVIDEFADLMLTAPADVETSLMGLAQKSRAVGIHIVLATQRPSVNVITGVIKANFPSRIAFQVASKTDSRTILDFNGAERLLGRGDMLFLPGGQGEPIRVHGAYISGEETERLVESMASVDYRPSEVAVFSDHTDIRSGQNGGDELFDQAAQLVVDHQQASTSFLQRRMKIGYSRAARLMDELEAAGMVGPADGAKPRQILVADDRDGDDEGDEPGS